MPIRALEFFSGLGGLHYGLEFADPTAQVVAAWDVNEHANACYKHNFGLTPSRQGIEYLDAKTIDKFNANCWLLSPPCQPYTRNGKELDVKDARAEGLLHLVQILNEVKAPPRYIFVENVPNFETSRSREMLVETLDRLQYEVHEFLVSPMQVGVANDRKRYYLTARRKCDEEEEEEKEATDAAVKPYLSRATFLTTPNHPDDPPLEPHEVPPIRNYLEAVEVDAVYSVPEHFITKRHKFRFDIVKPDSTRTSCFTKAYGSHHVIGSGSFLQTKAFETDYQPDDQQAILNVGMRFFTPTEVARLHAFPIDGEAAIHGGDATRPPPPHAFSFPSSVSLAQKWRLLGNSLNVRVVGTLIRDILLRNIQT
ncbi:C-5 cytosine-specific DNA methylase [Geranomyces variabilis]|uniref:tRNA (cytosine(38)-C(5))-methyltransferase n=1 Tax=Geranomyces variabilis TaxID=109894 RepID=A0AAD5TP75_9FUNG|nr:C-5 cytosine-specific DNA methylase [Geranomyces variabilis]